MNFEDLSGNQLVELYGNEFMGRSLLKRVASKTVKVVKKTGGVIARNPAAVVTGGASLLAPKSIQKKLNVGAAALTTGGVSLVATKSGRNATGSVARLTQTKILRPVSHGVATVARNPVAQQIAAKAAASFIPGASAAMTAANLLKSKARSAVAPFAQAAHKVQAAAPAPTIRKPHPANAPTPVVRKHVIAKTPAPTTLVAKSGNRHPSTAVQEVQQAHAGLSLPLMLGIGGVGLAGILLAVSMGKKNG